MVSYERALVLVLVYGLAAVVVSLAVFQRRDITSWFRHLGENRARPRRAKGASRSSSPEWWRKETGA